MDGVTVSIDKIKVATAIYQDDYSAVKSVDKEKLKKSLYYTKRGS